MGIRIKGLSDFTSADVKILQGAVDTHIFIFKARETLIQIDVNSNHGLAACFCTLLYTTPGITVWKFQPTSGAPQAISSTSDLMKEIYIDDEIVRTDMELFSMSYNVNDRYLLILHLQIIFWGQNILRKWKKDLVKSGRLKKGFTVVYKMGHWGAINSVARSVNPKTAPTALDARFS